MTNPLIRFVNKVCVQTAIYWGNPTNDGFGGYTYDPPVEISCRWEEKTQMVWANNGKEVVSKNELLLIQDVDLDCYLFLGTLDSLDPDKEDNPKNIEGAYKLLSFTKTPLFMSTTEFVRTAFL